MHYISLFFLTGAAYEVSGLSDNQLKEIMHGLAHPHMELFTEVEKSILGLVRNHYMDFSCTNEFTELPARIRDQKIKMSRDNTLNIGKKQNKKSRYGKWLKKGLDSFKGLESFKGMRK